MAYIIVRVETTAGTVMKQISFNNESKLHHITKYYSRLRQPYFLMNSLINLIHTICIIWS